MADREKVEEAQLWTIVMVLVIPSMVGILLVFSNDQVRKVLSNVWWSTGFGLVITAILVALPFFWKGQLSWREVFKRVFRRADSISVLLALAPIVVWEVALVLLTAQSSHPYYPRMPEWMFQRSGFQVPSLLTTFVGGLGGLLGTLLIVNASQYSNRAKFLLINYGLGILFVIASYRCLLNTMRPNLADFAFRFSNPYPEIVHYLGFAAVILGLMHRGRSSVTSIAIMLVTHRLAKIMGLFGDLRAMSIGLFGGAGLIFLINYLQQSGRVVPWSAENQT
jgi:hypothetical protein